MRKVLLAGAGAALVLGVAGAVAIPAASQAVPSNSAKSTALVFDVVFSPPEFVQANNVRNPDSPIRWATSSFSTTSSSRAAGTPAMRAAPA
jgi:hypothetical protein